MPADMFIFDLPYGIIRGVEWDKHTYTTEELSQLLQVFRSVQSKPAWFALFWVSVFDSHSLNNALQKNDYTDIYPIYWYKPHHIAVGRKDRHVPAVEVLVTARFTDGVKDALPVFMDKNPVKRHNVIMADKNKNFLRADGEKVNVCQKPIELYRQILPLYLKQGAKVFIGTSEPGVKSTLAFTSAWTAWLSRTTKHSSTTSHAGSATSTRSRLPTTSVMPNAP